MKKKKIVIIGGGIAGLSAGIYGLKSDFEVEIYEKHSILGGKCTGWDRGDFHIDNCIHWLAGTKEGTALYKLWQDLGALGENLDIIQEDRLYTVELNGETITLWKDLNRTEREMLELSPEDEVEIKKFIEYTKLSQSMIFPEKPMDMMGPIEMIKFVMSISDMKEVQKDYGKIDLNDLAERFKHPLLKSVMGDYLSKESLAHHLTVTYGLFTSGNGGIPKGGSRAMATRMKDKFEQLGGKVFTNSNVVKIELVKDKKAAGISLADGSIVNADYIICACDTHYTFHHLLAPSYMTPKMEEAYRDREAYPLHSGFHVAFSVDGSFDGVKGTLLFPCKELQVANHTVDILSVRNYAYDPDFAPHGKTVIQSMIVLPEETYDYWMDLYQDKEKYENIKEEIAKEILNRIEERFSEHKGKISILDTWTPATYHRYCHAYKGASMSFNITKESKKNRTFPGGIKGLDNVVIASQWLEPPGGLPVAAVSGKGAVQRILKKEKRSIKL